MKKAATSKLEELPTEQLNPASADLDIKSSLEIARIINAEDANVAGVVTRALPQIARGIDWIADALGKGGRLIYVGTGTSGRIAALDASECPPTFNVPSSTVQFVMAGGVRALQQLLDECGLPRFGAIGRAGKIQSRNYQAIRLKAVDKKGREFIAEHFIIGERRQSQWTFGAAIREVMPR